MGPEYDLVFVHFLKGFPLEFTRNIGNGMVIKMTAKEIAKKKLKDAEFLLPAGHDEMTPEQFQEIQEMIQEIQDSLGN